MTNFLPSDRPHPLISATFQQSVTPSVYSASWWNQSPHHPVIAITPPHTISSHKCSGSFLFFLLFFNQKKRFSILYILIISSPHPIPDPPTSLPTQPHILCLSLFKNKATTTAKNSTKRGIKKNKQKTSKTKKYVQTKQNKIKSPQKYHWICFVLANCSSGSFLIQTTVGFS